VIYLILIIAGWVPIFFFWYHLALAVKEEKAGGKGTAERSHYVKGAMAQIISYAIQFAVWPIFLTIIAGALGFAAAIFPMIEFAILLCLSCWWLSSAKKYAEQGKRAEAAGGAQ
jgi:hypothetical protein